MSKKLKTKLISYLIVFVVITLLSFFKLIDQPDLLIKKDKDIFCRIGMTTDPNRRKKEWEREYRKQGKSIISWVILNTYKSKSSAQEFETREANKQNCESQQGGRDSKKTIWYVYKLEYSNQ